LILAFITKSHCGWYNEGKGKICYDKEQGMNIKTKKTRQKQDS